MWENACNKAGMRRIAYAMNKPERTFADASADVIFIGLPNDRDQMTGLDRNLQAAMAACFPGDALVVLTMKDLPKKAQDVLAENGVAIEVIGGEPGRSPVFSPTDDQRKQLRGWWFKKPGTVYADAGAVCKQVCAWANWPDTPKNRARARAWLNDNIGLRSGRPKKR